MKFKGSPWKNRLGRVAEVGFRDASRSRNRRVVRTIGRRGPRKRRIASAAWVRSLSPIDGRTNGPERRVRIHHTGRTTSRVDHRSVIAVFRGFRIRNRRVKLSTAQATTPAGVPGGPRQVAGRGRSCGAQRTGVATSANPTSTPRTTGGAMGPSRAGACNTWQMGQSSSCSSPGAWWWTAMRAAMHNCAISATRETNRTMDFTW